MCHQIIYTLESLELSKSAFPKVQKPKENHPTLKQGSLLANREQIKYDDPLQQPWALQQAWALEFQSRLYKVAWKIHFRSLNSQSDPSKVYSHNCSQSVLSQSAHPKPLKNHCGPLNSQSVCSQKCKARVTASGFGGADAAVIAGVDALGLLILRLYRVF